MDYTLENRVAILERKLGTFDSKFSFSIVPAYIVSVSPNGYFIKVAELGSRVTHYATQLSPIPTSLDDGRRLQGIPVSHESQIDEYERGDCVLCAVVDKRWYILGYFNLPDRTSADTVSLVKEYEKSADPYEKGIILKINKFSYLLIREQNELKGFFGPWSNFSIIGPDFENNTTEPEYTLQIKNITEETWGSLEKKERIDPGDDTQELYWKTKYFDVKTVSHEPGYLSDSSLPQKQKNVSLHNPEENKSDLPYINKVITKVGYIPEHDHIYERDLRQSKDKNKEKTVFVNLKEGYREDDTIISEYEVEDTISKVKATKKIGSAIDTGRVLTENYQKYDSNEEPVEQLLEEFGENDSGNLWHKDLKNSDNEYYKESLDKKKHTVVFGNDTEKPVTEIVHSTDPGETNLETITIKDGDTAVLEKILTKDDYKIIIGDGKLTITHSSDGTYSVDSGEKDITFTTTGTFIVTGNSKLDGDSKITGNSDIDGNLTVSTNSSLENNVSLGKANASDPVISLGELKAYLGYLENLIKNHDHMSAMGPTTPATAGVVTAALLGVYSGQKSAKEASIKSSSKVKK